MFEISEYNYAIFDCDGVILNSNKIKSNAFAQSISNEPTNLIQEFIEYHKRNGGVSRYEKFRYYFEKLKKSDNTEFEIKRALSIYGDIVTKALCKCDYVPGVIDFILKLKHYGLRLFVVSGSDEKELVRVFKYRGISDFFEVILGSPVNKDDNAAEVYNLVGDQMRGVFFGDSKADYLAAKKIQNDFVFVKEYTEWDFFNDQTKNDFFIEVKNFKDL